MLIRVRHHRIFTEYIERLHVPGYCRVQRLNNGEARLQGQSRRIPCLFELFLHRFIRNLLIGRIYRVKSAHVACALNIVLSAQRIHTAPCNSEIAENHLKVRTGLNAVNT